VLLAAFAVIQAKARTPRIPREVVNDPGRVAANVVTFIFYSGMIATYFSLTLYFQQVLGCSALETGLMYLPPAVGFGLRREDSLRKSWRDTSATSRAARMFSMKDALAFGYSAGFLAATGLYVLCIAITLTMVKPMAQPAEPDPAP